MRKSLPRFFGLAILAGILSLSSLRGEKLFQYSTIDALLVGIFDGQITAGEILERGNFGLGTFNQLDGEMIVVDGVVYRADTTGSAKAVSADTLSPFAAVTHFSMENASPLEGEFADLNYQQLQSLLDEHLPSENLFYAIRIEGEFQQIKFRSVPAQEKPYPPLSAVVAEQSVFNKENIKGTLVGLRCPAFAKGVNVTGYHFHFITEDRKHGGHVLGLKSGDVTILLQTLTEWETKLPTSDPFLTTPLGGDHSGDLEKVEKGS